jgi:hypothetical protein
MDNWNRDDEPEEADEAAAPAPWEHPDYAAEPDGPAATPSPRPAARNFSGTSPDVAA